MRKRSQLRSHADDLQSTNFPICSPSLEATQTDCPGISSATNTLGKAAGESSARCWGGVRPAGAAMRRTNRRTNSHRQSLATFYCCAKPHVQFPLAPMKKAGAAAPATVPFLSISAFPLALPPASGGATKIKSNQTFKQTNDGTYRECKDTSGFFHTNFTY